MKKEKDNKNNNMGNSNININNHLIHEKLDFNYNDEKDKNKNLNKDIIKKAIKGNISIEEYIHHTVKKFYDNYCEKNGKDFSETKYIYFNESENDFTQRDSINYSLYDTLKTDNRYIQGTDSLGLNTEFNGQSLYFQNVPFNLKDSKTESIKIKIIDDALKNIKYPEEFNTHKKLQELNLNEEEKIYLGNGLKNIVKEVLLNYIESFYPDALFSIWYIKNMNTDLSFITLNYDISYLFNKTNFSMKEKQSLNDFNTEDSGRYNNNFNYSPQSWNTKNDYNDVIYFNNGKISPKFTHKTDIVEFADYREKSMSYLQKSRNLGLVEDVNTNGIDLNNIFDFIKYIMDDRDKVIKDVFDINEYEKESNIFNKNIINQLYNKAAESFIEKLNYKSELDFTFFILLNTKDKNEKYRKFDIKYKTVYQNELINSVLIKHILKYLIQRTSPDNKKELLNNFKLSKKNNNNNNKENNSIKESALLYEGLSFNDNNIKDTTKKAIGNSFNSMEYVENIFNNNIREKIENDYNKRNDYLWWLSYVDNSLNYKEKNKENLIKYKLIFPNNFLKKHEIDDQHPEKLQAVYMEIFTTLDSYNGQSVSCFEIQGQKDKDYYIKNVFDKYISKKLAEFNTNNEIEKKFKKVILTEFRSILLKSFSLYKLFTLNNWEINPQIIVTYLENKARNQKALELLYFLKISIKDSIESLDDLHANKDYYEINYRVTDETLRYIDHFYNVTDGIFFSKGGNITVLPHKETMGSLLNTDTVYMNPEYNDILREDLSVNLIPDMKNMQNFIYYILDSCQTFVFDLFSKESNSDINIYNEKFLISLFDEMDFKFIAYFKDYNQEISNKIINNLQNGKSVESQIELLDDYMTIKQSEKYFCCIYNFVTLYVKKQIYNYANIDKLVKNYKNNNVNFSKLTESESVIIENENNNLYQALTFDKFDNKDIIKNSIKNSISFSDIFEKNINNLFNTKTKTDIILNNNYKIKDNYSLSIYKKDLPDYNKKYNYTEFCLYNEKQLLYKNNSKNLNDIYNNLNNILSFILNKNNINEKYLAILTKLYYNVKKSELEKINPNYINSSFIITYIEQPINKKSIILLTYSIYLSNAFSPKEKKNIKLYRGLPETELKSKNNKMRPIGIILSNNQVNYLKDLVLYYNKSKIKINDNNSVNFIDLQNLNGIINYILNDVEKSFERMTLLIDPTSEEGKKLLMKLVNIIKKYPSYNSVIDIDKNNEESSEDYNNLYNELTECFINEFTEPFNKYYNIKELIKIIKNNNLILESTKELNYNNLQSLTFGEFNNKDIIKNSIKNNFDTQKFIENKFKQIEDNNTIQEKNKNILFWIDANPMENRIKQYFLPYIITTLEEDKKIKTNILDIIALFKQEKYENNYEYNFKKLKNKVNIILENYIKNKLEEKGNTKIKDILLHNYKSVILDVILKLRKLQWQDSNNADWSTSIRLFLYILYIENNIKNEKCLELSYSAEYNTKYSWADYNITYSDLRKRYTYNYDKADKSNIIYLNSIYNITNGIFFTNNNITVLPHKNTVGSFLNTNIDNKDNNNINIVVNYNNAFDFLNYILKTTENLIINLLDLDNKESEISVYSEKVLNKLFDIIYSYCFNTKYKQIIKNKIEINLDSEEENNIHVLRLNNEEIKAIEKHIFKFITKYMSNKIQDTIGSPQILIDNFNNNKLLKYDNITESVDFKNNKKINGLVFNNNLNKDIIKNTISKSIESSDFFPNLITKELNKLENIYNNKIINSDNIDIRVLNKNYIVPDIKHLYFNKTLNLNKLKEEYNIDINNFTAYYYTSLLYSNYNNLNYSNYNNINNNNININNIREIYKKHFKSYSEKIQNELEYLYIDKLLFGGLNLIQEKHQINSNDPVFKSSNIIYYYEIDKILNNNENNIKNNKKVVLLMYYNLNTFSIPNDYPDYVTSAKDILFKNYYGTKKENGATALIFNNGKIYPKYYDILDKEEGPYLKSAIINDSIISYDEYPDQENLSLKDIENLKKVINYFQETQIKLIEHAYTILDPTTKEGLTHFLNVVNILKQNKGVSHNYKESKVIKYFNDVLTEPYEKIFANIEELINDINNSETNSFLVESESNNLNNKMQSLTFDNLNKKDLVKNSIQNTASSFDIFNNKLKKELDKLREKYNQQTFNLNNSQIESQFYFNEYNKDNEYYLINNNAKKINNYTKYIINTYFESTFSTLDHLYYTNSFYNSRVIDAYRANTKVYITEEEEDLIFCYRLLDKGLRDNYYENNITVYYSEIDKKDKVHIKNKCMLILTYKVQNYIIKKTVNDWEDYLFNNGTGVEKIFYTGLNYKNSDNIHTISSLIFFNGKIYPKYCTYNEAFVTNPDIIMRTILNYDEYPDQENLSLKDIENLNKVIEYINKTALELIEKKYTILDPSTPEGLNHFFNVIKIIRKNKYSKNRHNIVIKYFNKILKKEYIKIFEDINNLINNINNNLINESDNLLNYNNLQSLTFDNLNKKDLVKNSIQKSFITRDYLLKTIKKEFNRIREKNIINEYGIKDDIFLDNSIYITENKNNDYFTLVVDIIRDLSIYINNNNKIFNIDNILDDVIDKEYNNIIKNHNEEYIIFLKLILNKIYNKINKFNNFTQYYIYYIENKKNKKNILLLSYTTNLSYKELNYSYDTAYSGVKYSESKSTNDENDVCFIFNNNKINIKSIYNDKHIYNFAEDIVTQHNDEELNDNLITINDIKNLINVLEYIINAQTNIIKLYYNYIDPRTEEGKKLLCTFINIIENKHIDNSSEYIGEKENLAELESINYFVNEIIDIPLKDIFENIHHLINLINKDLNIKIDNNIKDINESDNLLNYNNLQSLTFDNTNNKDIIKSGIKNSFSFSDYFKNNIKEIYNNKVNTDTTILNDYTEYKITNTYGLDEVGYQELDKKELQEVKNRGISNFNLLTFYLLNNKKITYSYINNAKENKLLGKKISSVLDKHNINITQNEIKILEAVNYIMEYYLSNNFIDCFFTINYIEQYQDDKTNNKKSIILLMYNFYLFTAFSTEDAAKDHSIEYTGISKTDTKINKDDKVGIILSNNQINYRYLSNETYNIIDSNELGYKTKIDDNSIASITDFKNLNNILNYIFNEVEEIIKRFIISLDPTSSEGEKLILKLVNIIKKYPDYYADKNNSEAYEALYQELKEYFAGTLENSLEKFTNINNLINNINKNVLNTPPINESTINNNLQNLTFNNTNNKDIIKSGIKNSFVIDTYYVLNHIEKEFNKIKNNTKNTINFNLGSIKNIVSYYINDKKLEDYKPGTYFGFSSIISKDMKLNILFNKNELNKTIKSIVKPYNISANNIKILLKVYTTIYNKLNIYSNCYSPNISIIYAENNTEKHKKSILLLRYQITILSSFSDNSFDNYNYNNTLTCYNGNKELNNININNSNILGLNNSTTNEIKDSLIKFFNNTIQPVYCFTDPVNTKQDILDHDYIPENNLVNIKDLQNLNKVIEYIIDVFTKADEQSLILLDPTTEEGKKLLFELIDIIKNEDEDEDENVSTVKFNKLIKYCDTKILDSFGVIFANINDLINNINKEVLINESSTEVNNKLQSLTFDNNISKELTKKSITNAVDPIDDEKFINIFDKLSNVLKSQPTSNLYIDKPYVVNNRLYYKQSNNSKKNNIKERQYDIFLYNPNLTNFYSYPRILNDNNIIIENKNILEYRLKYYPSDIKISYEFNIFLTESSEIPNLKLLSLEYDVNLKIFDTPEQFYKNIEYNNNTKLEISTLVYKICFGNNGKIGSKEEFDKEYIELCEKSNKDINKTIINKQNILSSDYPVNTINPIDIKNVTKMIYYIIDKGDSIIKEFILTIGTNEIENQISKLKLKYNVDYEDDDIIKKDIISIKKNIRQQLNKKMKNAFSNKDNFLPDFLKYISTKK